MSKLLDSTAYIQNYIPEIAPKLGIILGTGLADIVNIIDNCHSLLYKDIPGFPQTHIAGHPHQLHIGFLSGVPIVCLQGRSHFYEGIENQTIITLIRTLKQLGCNTLLITNSAGSLRADILPGDLILINDHINLQFNNVLVGYLSDNEDTSVFVSMENAYCPELRRKLLAVAQSCDLPLREGVYMGVLGPTFETPAEVRAFAQLGADVVGMSTIAEVMVARHCNMRVATLSVITNLGAGLSAVTLSHELTLHNAQQVSKKLQELLQKFIASNFS